MTFENKYIALALAIVVLGTGAFFSQQWFVGFSASQNEEGPSVARSYVVPVLLEGTALEATEAYAATDTKFLFSGRDFPGLGFFVEEINGLRSANGYYWILLVNDEKSALGASSARVERGDTVEWRYEKGY